ncbi:MAG: hypothetical protein ACRDH6_00375 [Actinomycetota bacterium]
MTTKAKSRSSGSTGPRTKRLAVAITFWTVMSMVAIAQPAAAARQDDADSGGDAGNTFQQATEVVPFGHYDGMLDSAAGDGHDFYRFDLAEGAAVSLLITLSAESTDPITLLDPRGVIVDVGTSVASVGISVSAGFTSEAPAVRLGVHRAVVAGEYRLHLSAEQFELGDYSLCFMNCETPQKSPIALIFGGSLRNTLTRVLLIPPSHGDLGNPAGPTVVDYLDATFRGIHKWTETMDAFATDYPEFSYLRDIEIHIEVFNGVDPIDPALYDIILGYAAAGPAFRGVAADADSGAVEQTIYNLGLGEDVRFTGRAIVLSLFGSSPRAGQVLYDFPEVVDLEVVTTHEFGHTFGLGHTANWHRKLGPDLMNSPAPFIYGDGFPGGDGGERTKMKCLSSLDLYGMAILYQWIPSGEWTPPEVSEVNLPPEIPYEWYC